jgi:uncharacterized membrane protein YfcA
MLRETEKLISGRWMIDLAVLGLAAFLAGMIDAVVGGGGLIQIPALFSVFPGVQPAMLFGTNKLAAVWGTGVAAFAYARRVRVEWGAAGPAALAALIFSFLGAFAVTRVPADFVRKLLPFILVAVAVYTFRRKEFGSVHAPVFGGWKERAVAVGVGSGIGFYDGFFGPGTGSFLLFLFVRFFGFDFLRASAAAKVVNVACNLAALAWFGFSGNIILAVALVMAVCNVAGSVVGTRLAIQRGSGFVRRVFLVVVSMLIVKTAYDAFAR